MTWPHVPKRTSPHMQHHTATSQGPHATGGVNGTPGRTGATTAAAKPCAPLTPFKGPPASTNAFGDDLALLQQAFGAGVGDSDWALVSRTLSLGARHRQVGGSGTGPSCHARCRWVRSIQ